MKVTVVYGCRRQIKLVRGQFHITSQCCVVLRGLEYCCAPVYPQETTTLLPQTVTKGTALNCIDGTGTNVPSKEKSSSGSQDEELVSCKGLQ
ncbi:hypothetical protein XELAEV_18002426mg [Xenopus laevis]|nr:hypothetical protein XELAEV_18002426mg [Xenopus laevis]